MQAFAPKAILIRGEERVLPLLVLTVAIIGPVAVAVGHSG